MSRRIVMTAVTAAAVFTTGCFDIPPYKPLISVDYTNDKSGGGGTAKGPGFSLHFASNAGFHFPDQLMIDDGTGSTNVLSHDTTAGCATQDETGILLAPMSRISANSPAMPAMSSLVPVLQGPAVVQVKLDWTTRFACDPTRNPGGTSIFTVFPDGRIVRDDTVADSSTNEIFPGTCQCESGAGSMGFNSSTFWALARDRFLKLYAPDEMTLPDPSAGVTTHEATACIDNVSYQVAFAWHGTESNSTQSTIRPGPNEIVFGQDLTQEGAPNLLDFSWQNSSAIFIGRKSTCPAEVMRAQEYVTPSSLMINNGNGAIMVSPSARDGIYGGAGGNDPPGMMISTDQVELTGSVPSSFAVWLQFPHKVDALRATLEGKTGAWYLPQQVADGSWIVWFRDALMPGQTITIKPN